MFKIAIVGEAYGEVEDVWKKPFVGPAGDELNRLLEDAGIERSSCFITNVFNLRPERNDIASLCGPARHPDTVPGLPAISSGNYLLSQHFGEVARLRRELEEVRPNLVVLLGNTAVWAVLGGGAISKLRGTVSTSSLIPGLKCLPTYHPSAVLRQYDLRHVTVLDLQKAKREAEYPEVRRPHRKVFVAETIADVRDLKSRFLDSASEICIDIETASLQMTCIGFAPSIEVAVVVPFWDKRKPGWNYWKSLEEEVEAMRLVAEICALPARKSGQNFLYDIQYLWAQYGIPVANFTDDTMLLHHSLQPESEKGLGFLGSVYTNETAWKSERPRGEHTIKRED